jgi:hypothetical protein
MEREELDAARLNQARREMEQEHAPPEEAGWRIVAAIEDMRCVAGS